MVVINQSPGGAIIQFIIIKPSPALTTRINIYRSTSDRRQKTGDRRQKTSDIRHQTDNGMTELQQ